MVISAGHCTDTGDFSFFSLSGIGFAFYYCNEQKNHRNSNLSKSNPCMLDYPLPILGFCAFSGTGKTTLLTCLLPLLKSRGLRVGVVKHAHHSFDLDCPGRESHALRSAGAEQLLIASRHRIAWIEETPKSEGEPKLADVLRILDPKRLDLVLVEGFKREPFPKIELHRPALGTPLLHPRDPNIVAIATDTPLLSQTPGLCRLDLNRPDQIAAFIIDKIYRGWIAMHDCGAFLHAL